MMLTRTGQIQVSQSFLKGWIGNPEPSNNYKTHFHQPLTIIHANKTNFSVQVPSTIRIGTKIVRTGHRISHEVKAQTPAIKALNIAVQQKKTLIKQYLSNWRLKVATTQKLSPFFLCLKATYEKFNSKQEQNKIPTWSARSLHWQVSTFPQSRCQQTQ